MISAKLVTGIVYCSRIVTQPRGMYLQEFVFTPSGQVWGSLARVINKPEYRLTSRTFYSIDELDSMVDVLEKKGYTSEWTLGWSPECRRIAKLEIKDCGFFPCFGGCLCKDH